MSISYRLIRCDELSPELVMQWRSIQHAGAGLRSPYFCPEFSRCVGNARPDARVVVIEDGQRVVGFFPFQTGVLGIGKPIGGALSDFHGVVAAPDCDWRVPDLLRAAKLSVWTFDHLVGGNAAFGTSVHGRAISPEIDLSEGYSAYVKGRRDAGSDYISKTEGLARKLGREHGDIEFTLHESSTAAFDTLIAWKAQQYRDAGTINVFGVPWTAALLRQVLASNGTDFAGLCSVLKVGGRIVAGHIGMRSRDVFHYWFPAYDPAYAKFSTGIILLLRMAEELAPQGIRRFDLGKGQSLYKQRLMTGAVEVGEGSLERPSVLTWLRGLRRQVERLSVQVGDGSVLQLPMRVVRRVERATRLR